MGARESLDESPWDASRNRVDAGVAGVTWISPALSITYPCGIRSASKRRMHGPHTTSFGLGPFG
jgi:hypothetical protein